MLDLIRSHIEEISKQACGYGDIATDAFACLLSGANMVLIGPPGEGKSMFARMFCDAIGSDAHFDWLLSRSTEPDELFGPFDVTAYTRGEVKRITTGKLPSADTAFLDEVFKCNSEILNSLLSIMNERMYAGEPVPLRFVIGASNELPDGYRNGRNGIPQRTGGDDLGAFWDRFLLRKMVVPASHSGVLRIIRDTLEPSQHVEPLTSDQINDAVAQVSRVDVSARIASVYLDLIDALEGEGVIVSTRRKVQAMQLAKAYAYLLGNDEVCEDSLSWVADCFWTTEDQRDVVYTAFSKLVSVEIREMSAQAESLRHVVDGAVHSEDVNDLVRACAQAAQVEQEIRSSMALLDSESLRRKAQPVLDLVVELRARAKSQLKAQVDGDDV